MLLFCADRVASFGQQRRLTMTFDEKIAELRKFVDYSFRNVGECDFRTLRAVAHDALDKFDAGDSLAASIGIDRLGPENARKMRTKLGRLGIKLE